MSKINTIKENHLFSKVYAKGKSTAGKYFAVYALRNFRSPETRFGITVNKKLGGAVERNRVKRLARESFCAITAQHTLKMPYLIVVVARSAAFRKGVKTPFVQEDLFQSMKKISLFAEQVEK